MISSQVIQKTLDELRSITRIDLCVMDVDGKVNSTTFPIEDEDFGDISSFVESMADSQVIRGYHFFKIYDGQTVEFILIAKGGNEDTYMIGRVAVAEIQNLIVAYKERFHKSNFIQNLILDNLLLVDVYNRAKKLHIPVEAKRVVILVEIRNEKDQDAIVYETTPVENFELYPNRGIITQGNDILADPAIDRFVPADKHHQRHFRGQRLQYLLQKKQGEITKEYLEECLKDHYGYPASVCNHAGDEGLQTIASMLYCVSEGYALIAWGNPCEYDYERYVLE